MSANISTGQPTFSHFIRSDKTLRRFLIFAMVAILLQWGLFRLFYPFPSFFFTDSFAYLHAAAFNLDAHVWPIGYSKFLRVFNTFFHSDTALVSFQYLFLQACSLYFFATVTYCFRPSKPVSIILFSLLIINPLFLYLANSVSSDALFTGLSLCWIAQLMRMIGHPSRRGIFIHATLLALLFTLRYTAIYYPFIGLVAILFSAYTLKEKLLAITLPLLLVGGFMLYTANAMHTLTGVEKFSPFSGWQLANNALYMMGPDRLPPPASQQVPPQFRELNGRVRSYFDSAKTEKTLFDSLYPGIFYLWSPKSPLAGYQGLEARRDSAASWLKGWATNSVLYADYGSWLIRRHPLAYAQYYCWPNLQRYAFPPLEFMERYNCGMDTVDRLAAAWFRYKDQRVKTFSVAAQASILAPYPFLNMLINLLLLGMFGLFFTTKAARNADPVFFRQMVMAGSVWLIHLAFSIVAAPVVLRYQVFPMILGGACSLLLAERLLKGDIKFFRKKIITECCAFSLVFLFVYAATSKLFRLELFRFQLGLFPWLRHWADWLAWGLPLVELLIAALLISSRKKILGFYASFALMTLLTAYLVCMLVTERENLPCSCSGVIEGLSWKQQIGLNLFFMGLAGLGILMFHPFKRSIMKKRIFYVIIIALAMTSSAFTLTKKVHTSSGNLYWFPLNTVGAPQAVSNLVYQSSDPAQCANWGMGFYCVGGYTSYTSAGPGLYAAAGVEVALDYHIY
ncbi:MAG TPA: MauE/DoxX family redox-associated membrane protein [Puia sp.]|nr:MauE/DoxX family redox-associated membrane protein [Puia sp.]